MRSSEAEARERDGEAAVIACDPNADQRRIRPTRAIRDLSEYLAFLEQVEAIFGPTRKPRRIARGGRFLL